MMLHQHPSAPSQQPPFLSISLLIFLPFIGLFHTLATQSGHSLSLTALHLLPIVEHGQLIYVPAKDVQLGDLLRVLMKDGRMIDSAVMELKMEMKDGFYAPLTMDGE